MEGAPVTAATGALGPAVAKLGALLGSEYKLRRQTWKDVRSIKSKLKSMHSILWTIWEREDLDAESKGLKKEALDLADDLDDAIDDFILSMERGTRDDEHSRQSKIMASPFQDFKTRVNDVSGRCHRKWKAGKNKYARRPISGASEPPPPRAPFVRTDASELAGMGRWKRDLIRYLLREEPLLRMASIVGMGGVGKTTLARLVYEEIENKFQCRAFVSVTPRPNMKEVLASILQQVGAGPLAGTKASTEEHIIRTISNFLQDKRYLVVIDDIWHRGEWDIIRKSFPGNKLGSRIVMTTRNYSVPGDDSDNNKMCIRMNPIFTFTTKSRWLYGPGEEDVAAWMKKHADMVGEGFDCDHCIVRMCGGVPLALLCMYSAVAKFREQQEQQGVHVNACDVQDMVEKQVKRSGIQNTPGFEPLVESFQLGYDDLPHHMLRTCLLYCGIYPENYHFRKREDLVMRWAAEGFISKKDGANGYLDEICNRGLMLPNDSFRLPYQMNPMMRNFLRWKSREDDFITCSSDITSSYACRIYRLCIDDYRGDAGAVEVLDPFPGLDWSHIRSLVVFEGDNRLPLEKLERVRVLDLQFTQTFGNHVKDICGLPCVRHLIGLAGSGISEIPQEIARLQYLETLQVRETSITELPSEIGNLQHLKTLDVSGGCITRLPSEIGNLQNLETLNLSYNRLLKELPREVGKLCNLKQLLLSGTDMEKIPREIEGLKKLKTLKLDDTTVVLPWTVVPLSKSEGMSDRIRLAWESSDLVYELAGEIMFIQMGGFYSDMRGLIVGTKHMHVPGWIKDQLNGLAYLDIRICILEEQDLKILREMPSLAYLTLRFQVVPRKHISISCEGFPELRMLVVDSRVPRVTFQEGAMPRLETLWFRFQSHGGPPNRDPLGIKHLLGLHSVVFTCSDWYRADSPCISTTIDVARKEAQEHRNSIGFYVYGREDETFPASTSLTGIDWFLAEYC